MATFNPPPALFRSQIESIRAQAHASWMCVIQDDASDAAGLALIRETLSDDPRFTLQVNAKRLGFYDNFERALQRVPADSELICLADQDDTWHPQKLATLAKAFNDPAVMLAYADARVVDAHGTVLAEKFSESARRPLDFESHFFTNTIPGATCMFRASLLKRILAFPRPRGRAYHDWWIVLTALAAGEVLHVNHVLQDYVQHEANAVGWRHAPRGLGVSRLVTSSNHRRDLLATARRMYEEDCAYLANAIGTLCERFPQSKEMPAMMRLRGLLTHPRRTMLRQYARALRSATGARRERNLLLAQLLGRSK